MESIAQQMQWVLGLHYRPRLIRWPNHDHCSCINLVSWILLSKTSNRQIKLKSLTVSRFTFMFDHVIYPWLDTLIVNLLVWNNSRLQPSNRPAIKNNAISCFTFMIDTRFIGPILFLNIFGLFITPRLSTFNSGGNSGLILEGTLKWKLDPYQNSENFRKSYQLSFLAQF